VVEIEELIRAGLRGGEYKDLVSEKMRLEMGIGDWGVSTVTAVLAQTTKMASRSSGAEGKLLTKQASVLQRVVAQHGGWRKAVELPNGKVYSI
jgi:hypothetical protein